MINCPCGSEAEYKKCCGPIHTGKQKAKSAEALMRARYSAYTKGEIDFIEMSYHPDKRHEFNKDETVKWSKSSKWKGLKILSAEGSRVEFLAEYEVDETLYHHHEVAEFKQENDEWFFFDGRIVNEPITRETPKIGRNDMCPCGSGKKYKKCCLK